MKKSIYSKHNDIFLQELKKARADAGLSQIDLAKKLKSTQSIVSKGERGERRIDVIELRHWLIALGTTLPEFAEHLESALGTRRRRG